MKKTWLLLKITMTITPKPPVVLDDVIEDMELLFRFNPRNAADVVDQEMTQFDSEEGKVKGKHKVELQVRLFVYHDGSNLDELMEILVCTATPSKECPGTITDVKVADYEMEDSR
jgi:hypothetical protein